MSAIAQVKKLISILAVGICFLWGCAQPPGDSSSLDVGEAPGGDFWLIQSLEAVDPSDEGQQPQGKSDAPSKEVENPRGTAFPVPGNLFSGEQSQTVSSNFSATGKEIFLLEPQANNPALGCFDSGCHPYPVIQEGWQVHDPFLDATCETCHLIPADHPQGSGSHQATLRDIEICLPCHTIDEFGTSHPVDEELIDPLTRELFTCTSTCHDPHAAPNKALLRYPGGGSLCLKCHEKDF